MKLSNSHLRSLVHGAYRYVDRPRGYMSFCHYDEAQCRYLQFNQSFYEHAFFTSSVTIELITDAEKIAFDYKIYTVGLKNTIWTKDTIDVYVDTTPIAVKQVCEMGEKGTLTFDLPKGNKKITLYLPLDADIGIKNFTIDGKWRKTPPKKTKVLWIGDSITQGYGAFITGQTYVNVANRLLGYEILNQGIGGYYYDEHILTPISDFQPDKIIIAMGTNQFLGKEKSETIPAFYRKLAAVYPDVPVLTITPLWRHDYIEQRAAFDECVSIIQKSAAPYPNITVIDGFQLVPGCAEYYIDGLHPNALGMTLYGQNLAAKIQKLGW